VEVACEAARDASAFLGESAELSCIFFPFSKSVVCLLLEVEGLVEDDAKELV